MAAAQPQQAPKIAAPQQPDPQQFPTYDYSERYYDDVYEYCHVTLPKEMASKIPRDKLFTEGEWRALGIKMSKGWNHIATHKPDRIRSVYLLFKRVKGYGAPKPVLQAHPYQG